MPPAGGRGHGAGLEWTSVENVLGTDRACCGSVPHPLDPDWNLVDRRKKHLLAVGWRQGSAKLCVIQFHKDGFFVHFPFHPDESGVIARCSVSAESSRLDLTDQGGDHECCRCGELGPTCSRDRCGRINRPKLKVVPRDRAGRVHRARAAEGSPGGGRAPRRSIHGFRALLSSTSRLRGQRPTTDATASICGFRDWTHGRRRDPEVPVGRARDSEHQGSYQGARARPIDGSGARGSERTARPRRSRQTRPQSSRCDRRAPNDTEVVSDTDA